MAVNYYEARKFMRKEILQTTEKQIVEKIGMEKADPKKVIHKTVE